MHPKNISIAAYTYHLPDEKIATYPPIERDTSKLLIYKNAHIKQDIYKNIAVHIPHGAFMVFNNTKVIEARLLFHKQTGSVIEIFCLEPHEKYADMTTAMSKTGSVQWLCLVGGASKWKQGLLLEKRLSVIEKEILLQAVCVEKRADCFVIELSWNDDQISFAEILHVAGQVPLPPYIRRQVEQDDANRYQTVYAQYDGSVAAPTAGLHFTNEVLNGLQRRKIQKDFVTLHVGAGTFKPVKAETMQEHEMHTEYMEVSANFITNLIHAKGSGVIAVGTTSLRTIESLYWIGCKLLADEYIYDNHLPCLSQWDPYDITTDYPVHTALQALLWYLQKNHKEFLLAKTQIIIAPGYQFKIVNGLVTNFHQPTSTLLLLVAAFVGDDWRKIYSYALSNDFRFLSYGDGSLLWNNQKPPKLN